MNDDVQWMSQTIYTHKDRDYGTNGYMRVSVTTQTKDSMSFSPPTFMINIKNDGVNKNASLSYQQLFEIYNRLKEVVSSALEEYGSKNESPDTQLHYKVAKSTYFTVEFLRGNQGEPVVRLSVSHGSSNSTKIILPFTPEFHAFISLIGDMVDKRKYLDWCLQLPNRYFLVEMNEVMKQLPMLIRSAVVQIESTKPEPSDEGGGSEPDDDDEVESIETKDIQNAMNDLKDFMGENMENIDLEIPKNVDPPKEAKKPKVIEDKYFNWLEGDFRNYESKVLDCFTENPIGCFMRELKKSFPKLDIFPKISDKELKAITYLQARELAEYRNCKNNVSIPPSVGISKYFGYQHAKSENVDLAISLLALAFYLRASRIKLEDKIEDNRTNKAYSFYAATMTYPFIFSFITKDIEVKSVVMNKIREWKKLGLFDKFEKESLNPYGLQVDEKDIMSLIDALDKYMESTTYDVNCVDRFKNLSENFTLDMKINEEQITKELIPFEAKLFELGLDPKKNRADVTKLGKEMGISESVMRIFVKFQSGKIVPIVKFFEDHISEVPEDVQENFMNYILEYNDKDYDLTDNKFPYSSFGEEAIKALYLWKPESGEKYNTYKKFVKAVGNSNHDKQTILSMTVSEGETDESNSFSDYFGKV